APPRQVPHGALVEELGQCVDVARVERVVSALHDRYVLIWSYGSLLIAVFGRGTAVAQLLGSSELENRASLRDLGSGNRDGGLLPLWLFVGRDRAVRGPRAAPPARGQRSLLRVIA